MTWASPVWRWRTRPWAERRWRASGRTGRSASAPGHVYHNPPGPLTSAGKTNNTNPTTTKTEVCIWYLCSGFFFPPWVNLKLIIVSVRLTDSGWSFSSNMSNSVRPSTSLKWVKGLNQRDNICQEILIMDLYTKQKVASLTSYKWIMIDGIGR